MSMMDLPKPLKPQETLELLRAYKAGDEKAKDTVIETNLRLVLYCAKKFDNTGIDVEDLFSIGLIGLIKAVHTFNIEKEIKFATYATRCIDNEILMFLRKGKKEKGSVSIESPITTDIDGNELTLMDVTPDKKILPFDETFVWNDTLAEVRDAMMTLSKRDREIVQLRYFEDQTQKEVAAALEISQSYISRIEKKVLKKIKKSLEVNQAKQERKENEMVRGATLKNKDKAIELLKTTRMTYAEIGEATGIAYGTIANYAQKHRPESVRKELQREAALAKAGMQPENKGDTDKAVQLLAEGKYTLAAISQMTGVPQGSLTRLRRLYEQGKYQWVNKAAKKVEIVVPVQTPVINEPAFMGEKDKERVAKTVEKKSISNISMAEAIKEFEDEVKAKLRAEVEAEVRAEMTGTSVAEQTSEFGAIQKFFTFKYNASGGRVSTMDFLDELHELAETLRASGNQFVTFTLNVEAE